MSLNNSGMSASQIIICWTNSQDPRVDVSQGFHIGPANDDLEKASKSAYGISLYVSSDRKVATKY